MFLTIVHIENDQSIGSERFVGRLSEAKELAEGMMVSNPDSRVEILDHHGVKLWPSASYSLSVRPGDK